MRWVSEDLSAGGRRFRSMPATPVVLVSTRTNVLTIAQFHFLTFRPWRIGVAVRHDRYSYGLIRDEGEFVVNVPGVELLEQVRACGRLSGRDGDKFAATGLTPMDSTKVGAVRIAECGAHIECVVSGEIAYEQRTWFVGDAVAADHADGWSGEQALLVDGRQYRLATEAFGPR